MSTEFDIDRIANLARLTLTADEKQRLGQQMSNIVEYINQLNGLDTSKVEPTSHVLPVQNVFRNDESEPYFQKADYLVLAPKQDKGHYEVPQIIG
jgi:aspartyl-tRNA(Asn)/glutamyl-tRNA(Gln) amidotransferase subunit C